MKKNKTLVVVSVVIEILLSSCDGIDPARDNAVYFSSNTPYLQVDFPPPFFEDDDFGDFPLIGEIPFPICGNGRVEPTEQCDDGNADNLDGCNVLCLLPVCGNGAVELGEQCDDTILPTDPPGCSADCVFMVCGNKRVETTLGEECDDGNLKSGDGCSPCCKFEMCGNMILDPLEECDAGPSGGSGCTDCCKLMTGTSTGTETASP